MLFNSINFVIFFPIVVVVYFAFPKRYRYLWLLAASYYFYMSWNAKYALLLLTSTVITYLTGVVISSEKIAKGHRKIWMVISILCNVGILVIFKYLDFAVINLNRILNIMHISIIDKTWDILLPVGISFYTFQAMSYTIDVYKGEIKAEKNFARYALFVSFFPQLVAGPIERSGSLLKQIQKGTDFDYKNAKNGLLLMMWGYFEKLLIADRAAILVNEVYGNYEQYPGAAYVFATFLFAFQIYGDFAGYTHIAIGAAQVMGFRLMENFKQPYFATRLKDFWHRWHISLSTWFRDYLYIPLGGNRCSKLRANINLMITFIVSGLWHGASWNYVIWGGLHGIYQIIGKITYDVRLKIKKILRINTECFSYALLQRFFTFFLVSTAWFFFRVGDMRQGMSMIKNSLSDFNLPWLLYNGIYNMGLNEKKLWNLGTCILILLVVDFLHEKKINIHVFLEKQNMVFRWLCYLGITLILLFGVLQDYGSSAANFIYFQF